MLQLPLAHGLEEVKEWYGNPERHLTSFREHQIVKGPLPYPMRNSWGSHQVIRHVYLHRGIWPVVENAFREILREVGLKELQLLGWDSWGGGYVRRMKRGKKELSLHSWGIAFDLNPHLKEQPEVIVAAFEVRGFYHGRHFNDPMHFQAATGY